MKKILHTFTYLIWLVVEPTHLKKYQSKWVHLPWVGMNIKKSLSCQKPSYGLLPFRCFLKWWYPQNTPKWSFLVGKPEKLLGKPTILGNHHIAIYLFHIPSGFAHQPHCMLPYPCDVKRPAPCASVSRVRTFSASGVVESGKATVDGQNPAPPRMMILPLFIGF